MNKKFDIDEFHEIEDIEEMDNDIPGINTPKIDGKVSVK